MPKHVLRFWEGKFPQLRPMKRGGGRRYYRPEDVDLLRGIRWLLYSDGYTIKGVQRILRDSGVRFVKECWRGDAKQPDEKPAEARCPFPILPAKRLRKRVGAEAARSRPVRRQADPQAREPARQERGGRRSRRAAQPARLGSRRTGAVPRYAARRQPSPSAAPRKSRARSSAAACKPEQNRPSIRTGRGCAGTVDENAVDPAGVKRARLCLYLAVSAGSLFGAWRSPVSALVWGTRGRRFKSSRSDHYRIWDKVLPADARVTVLPLRGSCAINKRQRLNTGQRSDDYFSAPLLNPSRLKIRVQG